MVAAKKLLLPVPRLAFETDNNCVLSDSNRRRSTYTRRSRRHNNTTGRSTRSRRRMVSNANTTRHE